MTTPRHARKAPRITNRQMRGYVQKLQPFRNSKESVFSRLYAGSELASVPTRYVVYSYGEHFPMYVFDHQMQSWYGNEDKYSRTTSKHQSQACPFDIRDWFDTHQMQILARLGFMGLMQELSR